MIFQRPLILSRLLSALLAGLVAGIFLWRANFPPPSLKPGVKQTVLSTNPPVAGAASVRSDEELSRRKTLFPSFQKHPFAAARESGAFGWTVEDGKISAVIRQLAHNELEFERLAEESSRIYRRQLVYHKDTAAAQIERAKLFGAQIQRLALPGLDGTEVQFEITKRELNPSGQQGALSGEVAGRPGSLVTFAFKGGREAFTVLSPADKLYLVGEPREPGEIIVKSIDPETYVPGVCGTP